jgi:hypothetical protein
MHRFNYLAAGVVLAVTAALGGCDMMSSSPKTEAFHATLTAAQEGSQIKSNGTGTGEFVLDPATKQLSWTVTYANLTGDATAAHIHGPAAPGAQAGVVVNLAPGGIQNPIKGVTTLSDAQIADLEGGKYYVNVHTVENKGGEIRGQITP